MAISKNAAAASGNSSVIRSLSSSTFLSTLYTRFDLALLQTELGSAVVSSSSKYNYALSGRRRCQNQSNERQVNARQSVRLNQSLQSLSKSRFNSCEYYFLQTMADGSIGGCRGGWCFVSTSSLVPSRYNKTRTTKHVTIVYFLAAGKGRWVGMSVMLRLINRKMSMLKKDDAEQK
jgi:hypothetical protein